MLTFKNFITEQKNTHMTHLEDLVIDAGVDGTRQAINALRSLRNMLAGNSGSTNVSVKWDGAPAVFAGIDPSDGQFFVAKKGIFAKNPKVYKSHADIDADTSGDLNAKLKLAYDNLKALGITGVIQGDFMFDSKDLKKETIDGESYVTFHPNTIVYAIPSNSNLAKQITKAKIGIVWHTTYSGGSFETMRAEFGREIVPKLKKSANVWMVDATLPDLSGNATLSKAETDAITAKLSDAGKIFRKISSGVLKTIGEDSDLNMMINVFNNTKVRQGQRITDTKKHVDELIQYVNDRFQKEIEKRSSVKGKESQEAKRDKILAFFNNINKAQLKSVFDLQNIIVDVKLVLINKLNQLSNISTFVKTKNGFKVTNPEGFVAIDHMSGGAVKLVDRMEFSANNFNPEIIKGWDSPGRG